MATLQKIEEAITQLQTEYPNIQIIPEIWGVYLNLNTRMYEMYELIELIQCCPLGAVIQGQQWKDGDKDLPQAAARILQVSRKYVLGFLHGFDTTNKPITTLTNSFTDGQQDGSYLAKKYRHKDMSI